MPRPTPVKGSMGFQMQAEMERMRKDKVRPDIASYSTLINAHGAAEAEKLLDRMAGDKVKPNNTIYNALMRKHVKEGDRVEGCERIMRRMVRDGRKLRFHYHTECFSGDADPRTQQNSSFSTRNDYHEKTAPKLSSLEGPRACTDADGRKLGREVFKDKAPASVGVGKWNSGPLGVSRGYHPPAATLLTVKDLPCEKGRRRTYDNNK